MNKAGLIEEMASKAEISKAAASRALDAFMDVIVSALSKHDSISLVGFGSFTVRKRTERKGRNPRTGAEIKIKAANLPIFKAGQRLKDAVDNQKDGA